MSDELEPIRHAEFQDPLTAELQSQPTRELEKRLRSLQDAFTALSRSGAVTNILLRDEKISSDVELGNAVYFNDNSQKYEPAIAKAIFTGASYETVRSSMVIGIVVAVNGNQADILVGGTWTAATLISESLLQTGETYTPGVPYFLSMIEEGRITSRIPALAVQVLIGDSDHLVMSKVYNFPQGIDAINRYEIGMRPVGDTYQSGGDLLTTGFHALEESGGVWTSTQAVGQYEQTGYMVADGWAGGLDAPLWVEIEIAATTGAITVRQATTLEDLALETGVAYTSSVSNTTQPFAVTVANHEEVRTLNILNIDGEEVYVIKFKFATSGTFELDNTRKVLLRIPDSFAGWKSLEDDGNQIQPYYEPLADCDYPSFPHLPLPISDIYYNTKADPGFVANWPPNPIRRMLAVMNGVELPVSLMIHDREESTFEDPSPHLGVSPKTLYWTTQFSQTQPWPSNYTRLIKRPDGDVEAAKLTHCPAPDGEYWYWSELTYEMEPHLNRMWMYSNRLSNQYSSNRLSGVAVMPPLRAQDVLTGNEAAPGQPLSGNVLIWLDNESAISQTVNNINLGAVGGHVLFQNTTQSNVVIRDLTFAVTSQAGATLKNADLQLNYDSVHGAIVSVGTGSTGTTISNILMQQALDLYEWNTSVAVPMTSSTEIIPPGGIVRLTVLTPFPVEQLTSITVNGRIL